MIFSTNREEPKKHPFRAIKKARTPVRASEKVPASTRNETQELEARQTAHLRASRFITIKTCWFLSEATMRVSAKITNCGKSLPLWKRTKTVHSERNNVKSLHP